MVKLIKRLTLLVLGIFILSIFACAGPTRLEMDYGTSYNLQKFGQIADPAAGQKPEAVTGMDGQTVQVILDKYERGFEKAPPSQIYNFSIGKIN